MYTLIIDCNGYPLEHPAYIVNTDEQIIAIPHLSISKIADYINNTDAQVQSIKLSGPTSYCLGLKEEIENQLALTYANHNITIEVI